MNGGQMTILLAALAMMLLIVLIAGAAVYVLAVRPWMRAALHGFPVSLIRIVAMRLRGNPPLLLIDAYVLLKRASIDATMDDVENTYIDARNRVTTSDELADAVKMRTHSR